MKIRRAQIKDMERIDELLMQVAMVHHRGRPDLFKYGTRKYTDEQLKAIIGDDERPTWLRWMKKTDCWAMRSASSSSTSATIS